MPTQQNHTTATGDRRLILPSLARQRSIRPLVGEEREEGGGMTRTLGVGFIGAGRLVQVLHLPAFLAVPEATIVGLCDSRPGRADEVAAMHGLKAAVTTDYHALLARPEVEAVVVSVPNVLHMSVVLDALAAGKHVLCEKPPAMSADGAARMLVAARQAQRLLAYGFNNRYRDDVRQLRAFIDDGALGSIYYAHARQVRRRGAPRGWFTDRSISGGGALIDIGVHMLDLALSLMGYPRATHVAAATYSVFGDQRPAGARVWQAADVTAGAAPTVFDVEDLATAFIRLETGATLLLECAWALHTGEEPVNGVQLAGTRGGATLRPQELTIHTESAGQMVDIRPVIQTSGQNSHTLEARAFVAAVLRGEIGTEQAEQGLALMRIVDAIYASAESGAEVAIAQPGSTLA
jgi:predicted dehydrogenase